MALKVFRKLKHRFRNWLFERKAKQESLKRRGMGSFRGPTPEGVFQTVDVGAGEGRYSGRQAEQFKGRRYAAVDPQYILRFSVEELERIRQEARGDSFYRLPEFRRWTHIVEDLKQKGVTVFPTDVVGLVKKMRELGLKARHFNIDMPGRNIDKHGRYHDHYKYKEWFEQVPFVLLPNGKVFVTSEREDILQEIEEKAKQAGLKTRRRKDMLIEGLRTESMRKYVDKKIKRLEITFGLKKAIPNKNKRRNWPRVKR